jgi:hypothetical protein
MGSSETEPRQTINIQEIVIALTPPLGAGGPVFTPPLEPVPILHREVGGPAFVREHNPIKLFEMKTASPREWANAHEGQRP